MENGLAWRSECQKAAGVWPDKRAAGKVGDRAGNHHRQRDAGFLESLVDAEQRRLGVERVENGLDQNDIGAALDQAARGFA